MIRYSNTDNITTDISRVGYKNNNEKTDFNSSLNLNHKMNYNPPINTHMDNPFNNMFNNNSNNDTNKLLFNRNERFDKNMREKENKDNKEQNIESMNNEINKLKSTLNDVIEKDKEIQELKNKIYILNKDLLDKNGETDKIKQLEIEIKIIKTKLDEEYRTNNELILLQNQHEKINEENYNLKKNILDLNHKNNLFKLKKIIIKHINCDIDKLNSILNTNNINDNYFLINDIDPSLIKKIIESVNQGDKPDPWD
jgi:hypothetical protein